MFTTLATVSLLHWVALITPGQNVLLVSQLAASGHRRSALFAALGISIVALTWAILALLGVNAVFSAVPQLRMALQVAGGLYLCYVASRLWRSGTPTHASEGDALSALAAFRLGFLTNISNPKSALFFGSVFVTAMPPNPSHMMLAAAVVMAFINALAWHLFLVFAFSHPRVRAGYARSRTTLNRVAGAIVGAMGIRLLANTALELRKN